jgi:outer membrane protein assembly factor BamB
MYSFGTTTSTRMPSGKKVWEHEAASPVTSSPAVAKGKVIVATADGQVICVG